MTNENNSNNDNNAKFKLKSTPPICLPENPELKPGYPTAQPHKYTVKGIGRSYPLELLPIEAAAMSLN